MRALFIETSANASQDWTDAYSGLVPTSTGYGPFAAPTPHP